MQPCPQGHRFDSFSKAIPLAASPNLRLLLTGANVHHTAGGSAASPLCSNLHRPSHTPLKHKVLTYLLQKELGIRGGSRTVIAFFLLTTWKYVRILSIFHVGSLRNCQKVYPPGNQNPSEEPTFLVSSQFGLASELEGRLGDRS